MAGTNATSPYLVESVGVTRVAFVSGSAVVAASALALLLILVFRNQPVFFFSYVPFLLLVSLATGCVGSSTIILGQCFIASGEYMGKTENLIVTPEYILALQSLRTFLFFFGFILALSSQFSRLWQALLVFSMKSLRRPKVTIAHFLLISFCVGFLPFALLIIRIFAYPDDQSCGFVLAFSESLGSAVLAGIIYAYLLCLDMAVVRLVRALEHKGALVEDAHNLVVTTSFCLIFEPAIDLSVRYSGFYVDSAILLTSIAHSFALCFYLRRSFLPKLQRVNFTAPELMAHIRLENDLKDLEAETWHKNDLPYPLSKRWCEIFCCYETLVEPSSSFEQDIQVDLSHHPHQQQHTTVKSDSRPELSPQAKFITPKELRASYLAEVMASGEQNDDDLIYMRRQRKDPMFRSEADAHRTGADFDMRRSGMDPIRRSAADYFRRSTDPDYAPPSGIPSRPAGGVLGRVALAPIAASPNFSESKSSS